jgi:hypothetical protein
MNKVGIGLKGHKVHEVFRKNAAIGSIFESEDTLTYT